MKKISPPLVKSKLPSRTLSALSEQPYTVLTSIIWILISVPFVRTLKMFDLNLICRYAKVTGSSQD